MAGLTKKVSKGAVTRGQEMERSLKGQFNILHSMDFYDDYEIEKTLVKQQELELHYIKNRYELPENMVYFSPSGASKCKRELFYKALKQRKDDQPSFPYQKRWTRNSTAVHGAVQRDLLYMEKHLHSPAFKMTYVKDGIAAGLPAWEKNIQTHKVITHNDVTFALYGMMDGIMEYKDGSRVGFEFKTKSAKQDVVANMKKPSSSHVQQCVAYSLLFGMDEFLITYENVSKDEWRAGASAIDDIKPFYVKVTEKQKQNLLNKFAEVAEAVETAEIPKQETSKCMFCPYKTVCHALYQ